MEANIPEDDDDLDFYYDYAKAAKMDRSHCWTEENWQEQMEKHPLFATKTPESSENTELIEAFTQLKYDPEFNSVEELMESYRQDGNENYRLKRYRWAVDAYSEGIRLANEHLKKNPGDKTPSLHTKLAVLYNNRASAHFYLENYRSSLQDALRALMLDPKNHKATLRAAQCLFKLNKFEKCIEFCRNKLEEMDSTELDSEIKSKLSKDLEEYLKKAEINLKQQNRDQRKRENEIKKQLEEKKRIEEAVRRRGIRWRGSLFETPYQAVQFVHFDPENPEILAWPVIFAYPDEGQTDLIANFRETSTFREHLDVMFAEPPPWDEQGRYRSDTVKICYGTDEDEQPEYFPVDKRLIDVLPGKVIQQAIPIFSVKLL